VLNDAGTIGVRIVDAENKVRFMPVRIVSEGTGGVWVNGLPERVWLITVGQEEVFDGQVVRLDLSPLAAIVSS
jgi:multidrug efflux system membrane fusion protein